MIRDVGGYDGEEKGEERRGCGEALRVYAEKLLSLRMVGRKLKETLREKYVRAVR